MRRRPPRSVAVMGFVAGLALPASLLPAAARGATAPTTTRAPSAAHAVTGSDVSGTTDRSAPPATSGPTSRVPRFLYDAPNAHLETVVQSPKLPAAPVEGWVRIWGDTHGRRVVVTLSAPSGSYAVAVPAQSITVHKTKADVVVDPPLPFRGLTSDLDGVGVHWLEAGKDLWAAAYGSWTSVGVAASIAERSTLVAGRLIIEPEPGLQLVAEGPPSQIMSPAWSAAWTTENLQSASDERLVAQVFRYDPPLLAMLAAMWTTNDVATRKVRLGRLPGGSAGDVEAVWQDGANSLVVAVTHSVTDEAAVAAIAALRPVDEAKWRSAVVGHLSGIDEVPDSLRTAVATPLKSGTVSGSPWAIDALGDRCYKVRGASTTSTTICRRPTSPLAADLLGVTAAGGVEVLGVAPNLTATIEVLTPRGMVIGQATLDSASAVGETPVHPFALEAPVSDRALVVVARDARGEELGRTAVRPHREWLHSDPGFTWPTVAPVATRKIVGGTLDGLAWALDAPIGRDRLSTAGACALVRFGRRSFAVPCAPSITANDSLRAVWVVPMRRRFIVAFVGPEVTTVKVIHLDGTSTMTPTIRGDLGIGSIGRVAIVAVPSSDEVVGLVAGPTTAKVRVPGDRWATAWWSDPRVGLAQPG